MKLRDLLLIGLVLLALLYVGVRAARAQTPATVVRWTDPNVATEVWGPRSDRVVEVFVLPQHFSWWTQVPPPSERETAGTASTIYSHAVAMPDWPGCEEIVMRLRNVPTGLRSGWSNQVRSKDPCIAPPPERIIPVPEPPTSVMGYAALVTVAWIRRLRTSV